jgi:aminoglycoside 3-N-acetyltransferase
MEMTTEASVVQSTQAPRTRASLAADLHALGVRPNMTLLVHSSLSALGWVCGGPVAVVQALTDTLAPEGTLVMPTHTPGNSEPSRWQHPPVPSAWWQTIRLTMPAFDPRVTPTTGMGQIVEVFRTWPATVRSGHPQVSFAARGPNADYITANHVLSDGLGNSSPLARVYDLDGYVLLLGVGHARNTSFHLGEFRAPGAPRVQEGAAVLENGVRSWRTFSDVDWDASAFAEIGAQFDTTGSVRSGNVGSAEARLFRHRAAVDFAKDWISSRRAQAAL